MIVDSVTRLIGKTPLLRMHGYEKKHGLCAALLAKLEYFNPTGSVKDRPALAIIEQLEAEGRIGRNTLLIEPTSGNTGIGLAAVCAVKGYTLVLTMPETMSVERRKLLAAFGAKIVLTEGTDNAILEANARLHSGTWRRRSGIHYSRVRRVCSQSRLPELSELKSKRG